MTDKRLHEALAAIADLGPDPDPVRTRLAARVHHTRVRRTLVIAGAAAAAATAAGVPAAIWLGRARGTPLLPVDDGTLLAPPVEHPHRGNLSEPMMLRPTWLPPGLVEASRAATAWGEPDRFDQQRVWAGTNAVTLPVDQPSAAGLTLLIHRSGPSTGLPVPAVPSPSGTRLPYLPPGAPPNATVNGRNAWIHSDGPDQSTITWLVDDRTTAALTLAGQPDSAATVERIAKSMVPDSRTLCATSLRFGWLPPHQSNPEITVTGQTGWWRQGLAVGHVGSIPAWGRAVLATQLDRLGQTPSDGLADATLRGRPGRVGVARGYAEALVQVDQGRWLYVTADLKPDSAAQQVDIVTRMTNNIAIGADPDLTWIGRR